MNNEIHTFKNYRKQMSIPLHDVAHLLKMDTSNLAKMEKGIREPSIACIILYHVLFKLPLLELFTERYDELRALWKRRCRTLVEQLQIDQPPKYQNRIAYLHQFVANLTKETYER